MDSSENNSAIYFERINKNMKTFNIYWWVSIIINLLLIIILIISLFRLESVIDAFNV